MKIFKYLFISFLSIFLFFVPSFTVKASLIPSTQLPSVIPSVQQTQVMDFTTSLPTTYFNSSGMTLFGDSSFSDVLNSYNSETFLPSTYNWTEKPLNNMSWRPSANLYDKQGNLVDPEQVVLCTGQNDYGNTYFLYDSVSGDILNIGTTYESSISTINGSVKSKFWNVVDDVIDTFGMGSPAPTKYPCAIYDETLKTSAQIEEMLQLPNAFIVYSNSFYSPWFLMCPDVTNEHVYSDGVGHIYTDDIGKDMVSYGNTGAWNGDSFWAFSFSQGNYNFNGHHYSYCFPSYGKSFDGNFSISRVPTSPSVRDNDTSDVVWFTPSESYELPDTVNYDKLQRNPISYDRTYNNEFITNNYYTYDNYPIIVTPQNVPDYSPTYNYYYEYNEYLNTPQIGESIGSSNTEAPTDVPILSNLEKRFPFSIPFDLYNLFKGLSVQREAPHFEWEIHFPIIDYTWEIDIDLSMWDNQASLFRTCFMILFIIGLATFAYRHYFGS